MLGGMHGSYIIFNGIRYIFLSCRGQVVQVMREKMGNTGKWRHFSLSVQPGFRHSPHKPTCYGLTAD